MLGLSCSLSRPVLAGPPPTTVEPPACLQPEAGVSRTLKKNARDDQLERRKRRYDGMAERDDQRLAYVREQLEAKRICSAKDAWNAGVVLQHSMTSQDHLEAWRLFRWACDQGLSDACGWSALAWDRHLVSKGELQWYGTQWVGKLDPVTNEHVGMCLVRLEPGATDEVRVALGRQTLEELVQQAFIRNELVAPEELTLEALDTQGLVCDPVAWE